MKLAVMVGTQELVAPVGLVNLAEHLAVASKDVAELVAVAK